MFTYTTKVREDGQLEAEIIGDLDIDGTEVMNEELLPKMEKHEKVTLNFHQVPFVDSSGIGLLLQVVQHLKDEGVDVKITNIRDDVYEIFELLQIPDILGEEVFES